VVLGLVFLGTSSACGYRFIGGSASLPDRVGPVSVPLFTNATSEPGAEVLFTQALREGLLRSGCLADGADARVEGAVVSVNSAPFLSVPGRAPTYRLAASVGLSLKQGTRVVKTFQVSGEEIFSEGADLLWAETYRAAALRRLADQLMRNALERLAE
jgi:hypothetical protein